MKKLLKHKSGLTALLILFLLYITAAFSGFFSPYHYETEERLMSYAPPTKLNFFDSEGNFHIVPFVYRYEFKLNENKIRVYSEDKTKIYKLRFFSRGDNYKFLGLIPANIHFFTVEEDAKLYLFGADSRGRDMFSRLLYGGRVSLSIGLIAVLITFFIGLIVGGIAGYFGGRIDNLLMRLCEMIMLVPGFYLLLALRSSFPPEIGTVKIYFLIIIILSFIGWASLARVIRGLVLGLKEKDFVLAARSIGLSNFKIIIRHILPNTASYTLVAMMLSIPSYILGESALSLLGLGIQDPVPSWGNLLKDAMSIIQIKFYPWILMPGFFIFLAVAAFNMLGDALRDIYDPKKVTQL
ncbi:MAG TPA: ABC transporter permease [Candidatus Omnitrophica bacterium]|nr:ABC transporter permease [Candidatus Omnitrophota bacterium]